MKQMIRPLLFLAIPLALILVSSSAVACPVCYGAAENNTMDAANTAILTLLGITGVVLSGVVAFALYIRKRSREIREQLSADSYVDEQGKIHMNNKGKFEWNIS